MKLTTTKMRDGLSPKYWVERNAPLLKDLQFKYLDGTVLVATIHQGLNASVTVKVLLFVMIREVVQIERYTLKKVEGDTS